MTSPDNRQPYISGEDFVLEYGVLKYTFNELDFTQRCEYAAKKLGITVDDLDAEELEELIEFVASGEVQDPQTFLGYHLRQLEAQPELYVSYNAEITKKAEILPTHWLRRIVFRQAWLDQGVKMGELGLAFDDDSNDFIYTGPDGHPVALSPNPTYRAYK